MEIDGVIRRALGDAAMLARLTRDLPAFLRTPIATDQAATLVRQRLATRPERFLAVAERVIFGHSRSPYLKLLRVAGCELGDLRKLVAREGLEPALASLAGAGVYVTFDEFKGRQEAVRGSQRFFFAQEEFDNPWLPPHFESLTSGTRGSPSRVGWNLPFLADLAADLALVLAAHGLSRPTVVLWQTAPISYLLYYSKLGHPPTAWFHPLKPLPWRVVIGSRCLALLGRLGGCRLPTPVFADLREPERLAVWLGDHLSDGPICVVTFASSAVRIAAAAAEKGIDLSGVYFMAQGEPFTTARERIVERSGARAIVGYGATEVSTIAYSCAERQAADDLHIFGDRYALVQRTRAVGPDGLAVDAFLLTSLVPTAPKVVLNVETGDYGTFERRDCGCALGSVGLREHLTQIRSFEKLTGEGMTFAGTSLVRVLEEILPERFGGASPDYQLLEEERADGTPRLLLLVSPRVGPVDEREVRRVFLQELRRGGELEGYMARFWELARTVEIERQAPVATRAGKIFPFHLLERSAPAHAKHESPPSTANS